MKYALIVILALICINCEYIPEEEFTKVKSDEFPDQESWNASIIITKDGQMVGLLEASHIKKFSKKKITYIEDGLKVDFYNEQGEHTSILNSEGGRVYDIEQNMIAFGNVVVVSDSGMTLYTDTLKWNNKDQKIISEIPVKITTETDTIYGDSFISDPDLANYVITNSRAVSKRKLNLK